MKAEEEPCKTELNRIESNRTEPYRIVLYCTVLYKPNITKTPAPIHSFSSLSYDRPKASSKASSPHSAIQSFLLQMRVSSPFLKVIQ